MSDVVAQMLKLELSLLHHNHKADPAALDLLLSEEFEEVAASGQRATYAQVRQWLLTKDPSWRWDLQDLSVREAAPNLRVVQYRARQLVPPRPASRGAWHLSLWQRQDDHWRLWFHQATRLP